jgi:hypothetical protein
MTWGFGIFENSRYRSVFSLEVFRSSQVFVTNATLRSRASKNCLQRDRAEKLHLHKVFIFSMLHLQRFGAQSAI